LQIKTEEASTVNPLVSPGKRPPPVPYNLTNNSNSIPSSYNSFGKAAAKPPAVNASLFQPVADDNKSFSAPSPSHRNTVSEQKESNIPGPRPPPRLPPTTNTPAANEPIRPVPSGFISKGPPPRNASGTVFQAPVLFNTSSNTSNNDDNSSRISIGGAVPLTDNRGLHVLPPALKKEINNFQLSGFANEHFRVLKKKTGLMSSRKVTVAEVLSWQKETIDKSLLSSAKKLSNLAVQAFALVQNFMGDKDNIKKPQTNISKDLLALAAQKPALKDELYSHVCKQTNKNPDAKSAALGWRLLAVYTANLAPSRGFQEYILKYFSDNYHGAGDIKILAPWCYWRLLKTLKEGPMVEGSFELKEVENFIAKGGVPSHSVQFGGSLDYIVELQKAERLHPTVPQIMVNLCEAVKSHGGFQQKGIFRIAAQKEHIQALRNDIEQGRYDSLKTVHDAHIPADLLKIWLRGLYEPIFPTGMYEDCLKASESTPEVVKLAGKLTKVHFDSLEYLMNFLIELTSFHSVNAMSEENLAIVFCQDVLREEATAAASVTNLTLALAKTSKEKTFVRILLEQWKKGNKPKRPS
jgi:hypothetical protein